MSFSGWLSRDYQRDKGVIIFILGRSLDTSVHLNGQVTWAQQATRHASMGVPKAVPPRWSKSSGAAGGAPNFAAAECAFRV
ncbi:hypothetical protein CRG98_040829 [Punica granatum]|uniref:Uncharacterized protein n=1 Tax=Punica granatum TaxID=22663 RepID=A0A2I0I495_PUNGR|nr:hypothetical protein CRG98_040829 [Punica granatum]